ncbi:hypothetical protein ABTZ59_33385 [Streptomyces sp. NPDC094034]|uniref:hypothetical protein n=1 Tax=Streptomyces sp. NPDC094034 TaxID=3155309 RepID=UPI0033216272
MSDSHMRVDPTGFRAGGDADYGVSGSVEGDRGSSGHDLATHRGSRSPGDSWTGRTASWRWTAALGTLRAVCGEKHAHKLALYLDDRDVPDLIGQDEGVLSIFLFVARGLLDQLPEIINAWHRVQRAYRGAERNEGNSVDPDT